MKRFFWIPTALLAALLLAVLANAAAAERCAEEWCKTLEALDGAAREENWSGAEEQLAALRESWKAHTTWFHIISQHDALNEAEALLARAESHVRARDGAEVCACAAELRAQMRVLSEMQQLTLENIL